MCSDDAMKSNVEEHCMREGIPLEIYHLNDQKNICISKLISRYQDNYHQAETKIITTVMMFGMFTIKHPYCHLLHVHSFKLY